MRNLLRNAMFLACAAVMLFAVSACSDDDESVSYYTYTTSGSFSGSGSLSVNDYYIAAIKEVLGGVTYTTKKCDDEIIAACDAVYETHKTQYTSLSGTQNIIRVDGLYSSSDEELPSTIIATYTY